MWPEVATASGCPTLAISSCRANGPSLPSSFLASAGKLSGASPACDPKEEEVGERGKVEKSGTVYTKNVPSSLHDTLVRAWEAPAL